MYNLWSVPALVPCCLFLHISNCELIKSKQANTSMPAASGQTDFKRSGTKRCVSFHDFFLLFLGFQGSSIAEKSFETSHFSHSFQV